MTQTGVPILGKDACVMLNLVSRVDNINNDGMAEMEATRMVNKYLTFFEGLGMIKVNAKSHIDPIVNPVIDPAQRIPHAIENDVKHEL